MVIVEGLEGIWCHSGVYETTFELILLCVVRRNLLGIQECHKRSVFAPQGASVKWHHIPWLLYDRAEQSSHLMFPMVAYITADPPPCFTAGNRLCELLVSFGFSCPCGGNSKNESLDHVMLSHCAGVRVLCFLAKVMSLSVRREYN